MGRSRYRIYDEKAPHFMTCTVLNWMPLFTRPQAAAIILDALQYRQEQAGWRVYGYVILENHIHLVAQAENLSEEMPRFKSFTARKLIDYLEECRAERLLKQLAFFRKEHKQIVITSYGKKARTRKSSKTSRCCGKSWNTSIGTR